MTEKYISWLATQNWPHKLYLQGLHDDYEGFRIILEDKEGNGSVYKLDFKSHLAYRNIDEGDRLSSLSIFNKTKSDTKTIYTVESSAWLDWFRKENQGLYDNRKLLHFAIVTPNDWIDVISLEPPEISELTI